MADSVSDLIGMIDKGAAIQEPAKPIKPTKALKQPEQVLEMRADKPAPVMSQRGIRKRPFD